MLYAIHAEYCFAFRSKTLIPFPNIMNASRGLRNLVQIYRNEDQFWWSANPVQTNKQLACIQPALTVSVFVCFEGKLLVTLNFHKQDSGIQDNKTGNPPKTGPEEKKGKQMQKDRFSRLNTLCTLHFRHLLPGTKFCTLHLRHLLQCIQF